MAQGPVQIMDKPICHPYVCMGCGVSENRKYYVDTGLDVNQQMFAPLWEGRIYLCDQCMESVVTDYQRVLGIYLESINERERIASGNNGNKNEPGRTDGKSEVPNSDVDENSGSESRSEPPTAATLDSINPFLFPVD